MLILYMLLILCGAGAPSETDCIETCSFDTEEALSSASIATGGEGGYKDTKPKVADGRLHLLESWWKYHTSVAFPAPAKETMSCVDISFDLIMSKGTEGAGFAWLSLADSGEEGPAPEVEKWEAPGIAGSFGIGFDASNPVNRDPFRGSGNIYDRPQHEISLHWDGMEIVKATSPIDFRDEEPHRVEAKIEFMPGGAEISLSIGEKPVWENYFIPSMIAYAGRPAFGARNTETAGDVLIDDLRLALTGAIPAPEPPLTIVAIDKKLNDAKHTSHESTVAFPENADEYARIICTLRLDKPETRFDPWDRTATICAFSDEGERFEIIRYITPYHRGHLWRVDVTDFRPLLQGSRKIEQACTTHGEGWVVTVKFDFYPGKTDRLAYKVVNLWTGSPEIGNPEKPVGDFYTPKKIALDADTAFAKIRSVVTGHGMSPNTDNAAEFMPIGRTLTVNGESFKNRLWKEDNYLNPCRPQGGTWKYDRAGWAPGDVVRPWEVDLSHLVATSNTLDITYTLDPYINEARGETWAPSHKTEAQAILYRKPALSGD